MVNYSYPCVLTFNRKTTLLQVWTANLALFIYVSTHYLDTVEKLDFNQYVQLGQHGGVEVTHQTAVRELPVSILGSCKYFCLLFGLLLLCFYFVVQNPYFVMKICNSLCNVNSFSVLDILQYLWPMIWVSRFRPSVFNKSLLNVMYFDTLI